MIQVNQIILNQIFAHAEKCSPSECCGLIVVKRGRYSYNPCRNIAPSGRDFAIHPVDYAKAEIDGQIVCIVHSHPNTSPQPTPSDLVSCELHGLPWLIMNYPTGKTYQFEPNGYVMPMYGRPFQHGVVDCYAFVRDHYKQELGIDLPNYYRQDDWWLNGENLYLKNIEDAGFYQVDDLEVHDMIYMQVASPVPNHAAIYLGEGKIGHHLVNRLSSRDVYGGWYQKITTHIMRHKDGRAKQLKQ